MRFAMMEERPLIGRILTLRRTKGDPNLNPQNGNRKPNQEERFSTTKSFPSFTVILVVKNLNKYIKFMLYVINFMTGLLKCAHIYQCFYAVYIFRGVTSILL